MNINKTKEAIDGWSDSDGVYVVRDLGQIGKGVRGYGVEMTARLKTLAASHTRLLEAAKDYVEQFIAIDGDLDDIPDFVAAIAEAENRPSETVVK